MFRQEIEGEITKTRTGKAEIKLSSAIEDIVFNVHKLNPTPDERIRFQILDEWDLFVITVEV